MRKSRFTEAQIIGMIKEQEAGMPTAEVCRKHGLSQGTFYKFKSKYGGMEVSDAAKMVRKSTMIIAGRLEPDPHWQVVTGKGRSQPFEILKGVRDCQFAATLLTRDADQDLVTVF
jgi:putative transposase